MSVYIVAEAGVNHNGSVELALQLVEAAARVGADCVKFQTFRATSLVVPLADKASYQKATTKVGESQLQMLAKLELDFDAHKQLAACSQRVGIQFCSTAFDDESIELLRKLKMPFWKIPSGEITNLPYLRRIGWFNQPVILSTGMSSLDEVEAALVALVDSGTSLAKITLLHCTTEYPAPLEDVNLRAMLTMRDAFPGIAGVGYSDHTRGTEIAIAAVAMGATLIEKHFTLDRTLPGPDHQASLEPEELKALVSAIRNVEEAMGDGVKEPAKSELDNRRVVRKSLVASARILAGDRLTENNVTCKRPGKGISPMQWDCIIGRAAKRDYHPDEEIEI